MYIVSFIMLYVTPADSCSSKFVKDFMFIGTPQKDRKVGTRKIQGTHHLLYIIYIYTLYMMYLIHTIIIYYLHHLHHLHHRHHRHHLYYIIYTIPGNTFSASLWGSARSADRMGGFSWANALGRRPSRGYLRAPGFWEVLGKSNGSG